VVASAWGVIYLEPCVTNAFSRGIKNLPTSLGVVLWPKGYTSASPLIVVDASRMVLPQCGGS
jgi:hypothetical protein